MLWAHGGPGPVLDRGPVVRCAREKHHSGRAATAPDFKIVSQDSPRTDLETSQGGSPVREDPP